jgi:hypothetical protein
MIWRVLALATALFAALLCLPAPSHALVFQADSGISVSSTIVANNTTAIVISSVQTTVYSIDAYSNGSTAAYVKLYNSASATCGSGTPQWRGMIGPTSSGGAPIQLHNINGDSYINGVTMCVTTGIADTDTSAPAATTYIVNIHYKPISGPP